MHSSSAEKPVVGEGRQYHIACKPGDLAKYLLIPGAPERAAKIARLWDEAKEVAYHREFRSFMGKYKDVDISVLSSGIGPASLAIAVNEAANIGVETFLRIGSTGAIQRDIECGDLVISTAAVRLDGTSNNYVMPEYPAVANHEVLQALIEAAESLGVRYHMGITATTADFYAGQARPAFREYWQPNLENLIPSLQRAQVLNFEMECATLFILCTLFQLRAGAVCAVYTNRVTNIFKPGAGEEECIRVANEAIKILNDWDTQKQRKQKQWLYPSLLK